MSFQSKPKKAREPLNEQSLYDYAVKALGRHMRTEAELRRLLTGRVEQDPRGQGIVAAVIARLKEQKYLDDKAYAETFTRLRHENEKLGQRSVRQKLVQKGVPREVAEQAMEVRYAETNEEALARQHLARKRLGKPANEKDTARVMRRLVAAGFSTGVIYKILRQWDVPDDSLAALDNLEAGPPSDSDEN